MDVLNGASSVLNVVKKNVETFGYTAATAFLSSKYPREFECYMIAFELCNSRGFTIDYFIFPVMPSEIAILERMPTYIKNTFAGVATVSSSVFVPKDITLQGNFGKNFKFLTRDGLQSPIQSFKRGIAKEAFNQEIEVERGYGINSPLKQKELSSSIKTGYGCIKVLQSIINRSVDIDEWGNSNRLYFYNLAFGESYLVKVNSFSTNQSLQTNGIWNYQLKLAAVCPLHLDKYSKGASESSKATKAVMTTTQIQAGINTLLNSVKEAVL